MQLSASYSSKTVVLTELKGQIEVKEFFYATHTLAYSYTRVGTHSQTAEGRHYKEIIHRAVTVSDLPLPIQHKVKPDSGPSLTLQVIYVAPVSRLYLRAQRGMKVLTVGVREGGR